MTVLLVVLILLFLYPFVLYPLVVRAMAALWRVKPTPPSSRELPQVAMVVCALNEARVIAEKVQNCLALDYPKDKLKIVIVDDGSTDGTREIVQRYVDQGIELIAREKRRGKTANLNDVLQSRTEEIVVLSDANVIYDVQAVRRIVDRFVEDASVGGVSGKVAIVNTTEELQSAEGNYYSLEWMLQENESRIYSMVGADGAMYAIRRKLFEPVPDDTLIDDFVIAMGVVRKGMRMVFEPRAVGWECGPGSVGEEYRRKIRIAAGGAQGLIRGNIWPTGAPLRYWLLFLSHKVVRWLSPVTALLVLVVAALSWRHPLSMAVLAGALSLVMAMLARVMTRGSNPLLDAPFYFLLGQFALGVGLLRGLLGLQNVMWAKANR